MKYWYYTYEWHGHKAEDTFADLILFIKQQPENWILLFAKEISEESYNRIREHVG